MTKYEEEISLKEFVIDKFKNFEKVIETKSACTYLTETEQKKIDFCAADDNAIYWEVDKYPLRYDNLHYTILGVFSQDIDLAIYFNTGVLPF